MNKKVNLYLNSIEFITYVSFLLFMGLYLNNNIIILKQFLFLIGGISLLTFIGIELFLLLIMNNKSKIAYIGYMLFSIILGVLINIKVSYGAFIIFITFSLTKDILRVLFVDKLYESKEYKRLAKMFNIEVKDFRKHIKNTFNKTRVVIPVGNIAFNKKKNNKGYAQKDLV